MLSPGSPSVADAAELIETLDTIVFRLDARGCWVSLNAAWETQLGHVRAASLHREIGEFLHPSDGGEFLRRWAEVLAGTCRICRGEVCLSATGGAARRMRMSLRRIDDARGNFSGATGTLTDISEWKAAPEKPGPELAGADEGNRAKLEFLASLGHELRTPLNAVIGLSESLIEGAPAFDPERTKRYLGLIHQSGRQLLALINDIVDISRIDAGCTNLTRAAVDLGALCASTVEVVQRDARMRSIELAFAPAPSPVRVSADERMLRRVAQALVTHAVKITPVKGRVSVEVAVRSGGGGAMVVRDTAAANVAAKHAAAEPGRQLDGVELMLALVDRIARLHGGKLSVATTPGQGNTYTVEIFSPMISAITLPDTHP